MTANGGVQEDGSLNSDLEDAKTCSQVSCRRIAKHCSNLLDAVLIFKSWFIQRQSDLVSNTPEVDRLNGNNSFQPYTNGQRPVLRDQMNQHSASVERDWAIRRARRAESQLANLRNSLFGVRAQLEAGLRHKLEMEQMRREVMVYKDTLSHYRSMIDEGNHFRDDLKNELARVRKEASVLRARLASSNVQRPSTSSPIINTPQTSQYTAYDNADTVATTMIAVANFPENNQISQDTVIQLRREIERRTRLSESLKDEVNDLRQTLSVMLEKELIQSHLIDSVQTEFQTLCEPVWRILQKDYDVNQLKSLNSVLNIQCMTRVSKLLNIPVPDHVIMELSQFTECESTPDKCAKSKRSRRSVNSSTSKRSKKSVNETDNKAGPSCAISKSPTMKTNGRKSCAVNKSPSANSVICVKELITNRCQVDLDDSLNDCGMVDVKSLANESCGDSNKVEVMSISSMSESEASKSNCRDLIIPDISSDDNDDGDDDDDDANDHNEPLTICDENMPADSNKMIESPSHEMNCTSLAPDTCSSPKNRSRNSPNGYNKKSDFSSMPNTRSDINTTPNLQSKSVENSPECSQRCLRISETSPVMNNTSEGSKGSTEVVDVPDISDKITKTPDLSSSKESEVAQKIITRNKLMIDPPILDSPLSPSPPPANNRNDDNVVVNSCGESLCSDSKQSISNEMKNSQKPIKRRVQQIKKLENGRSKVNLSLDNVPSRVLTCPSLYTRGSQSNKSDVEFFSLLLDKYPSSVLQWCDQLSSSTFLHEIPNILTTSSHSTPTKSNDSSVPPNSSVDNELVPENHTKPKKKKRPSKSTNAKAV
ncbi:unnamed protein product [Trichobilharzia szidati]|nr:unnamed protein product [Trichobilharzia szidati]